MRRASLAILSAVLVLILGSRATAQVEANQPGSAIPPDCSCTTLAVPEPGAVMTCTLFSATLGLAWLRKNKGRRK